MASTFVSRLVWSGALQPARDAATFSRDLNVSFGGVRLPMSAAPDFRGDRSRANPEQLFVASISACQALTYLFLAARSGLAIVSYADDAEGVLGSVDGKTRMYRVTLRPRISIAAGSNEGLARELVEKAHQGCFIANSVSAVVQIEPRIVAADLCSESA
ncbi:MAG TPA: OsmC family protein [Vicinamibacterales bacterium]|nr:OsmC family protein [Vicinamibacterales bacterium]